MQKSGQTPSVNGSVDGDDEPIDFGTYLGVNVPYESERAEAILCMAMLESMVQEAIYSVFDIEDKHAAAIIGTQESAGTLGFSDQCRLAYCLKLVGPMTLSDLLILAKVRNIFAHRGDILSFSQGKIRDYCASLKGPEALTEVPDWFAHGQSPRPNIAEAFRAKFDLTVPRNRFLFCCWTFISGVNNESKRLVDEPNTPPKWLL
jgi:hypothetical protein